MGNEKLIKKIKALKKSEKCNCQNWKFPHCCDGVERNKQYNACLKDVVAVIRGSDPIVHTPHGIKKWSEISYFMSGPYTLRLTKKGETLQSVLLKHFYTDAKDNYMMDYDGAVASILSLIRQKCQDLKKKHKPTTECQLGCILCFNNQALENLKNELERV